MRSWLWVMALLVMFSACGGEAPTSDDAGQAREATRTGPTGPVPIASVIDSTIAPAVAGESGWDYALSTDVDLDGDGVLERVVLTARVEMPQGRPAWDDGQPWQVYVEAADGSRMYVYARRLQLGTLQLRVTRGDDSPGANDVALPINPTIVLIEHLPDRLRILEVSYAGPDEAVSVIMPFERHLDPRGDTASPQYP